ncbi:MAG TPA: class I SAM-dependent methyltransferase [Steroidobacteraceae bacterium]|nr:class I SAM-dependent methyltransferase [Steroidobacteraceae bacterium]
MNAVEYWDNIFAQGGADRDSRLEMPRAEDPVLRRAQAHFGDVRGRTLIDVGCGRGAASLYFAARGANVISVDRSAVAIANLAAYCKEQGLRNVRALQLSALELASLAPADLVFGAMILHHIEPFAQFATALRRALAPAGKAFFWENNARSSLMIWCRQHIVGRLWIPKYGDQDEFPLTPHEVAQLRQHFSVEVEYPELVLFRMLSLYLLRGRCSRPFALADRIGYRLRWLRPYSYRQYLCLS